LETEEVIYIFFLYRGIRGSVQGRPVGGESHPRQVDRYHRWLRIMLGQWMIITTFRNTMSIVAVGSIEVMFGR
jgi:hypothetical protein